MPALKELLSRNAFGSAAVAVVLHRGSRVAGEALGFSKHEAGQPVTEDTVFDLASLTKPIVAVALLTLVEEGALSLDEPLHGPITLRQLLSHVSGLPAIMRPGADALREPLVREPGAGFEYSCVGFIVAGLLASSVAGVALDTLVRQRVLDPLGMHDTGYRPLRRATAAAPGTTADAPGTTAAAAAGHPAAGGLAGGTVGGAFGGAAGSTGAEGCKGVAATEVQEGRGLVHGEVHDEVAFALGGVSGNAGLFGTARDVARFGEMLRRGGSLDGVRILRPETVAEMTRDQLPSHVDPGYRHGLGVRLNDASFMGALCGDALGHTGFTGTSFVVDRARELVVVLLTNRVHPSRDLIDLAPLRRAVAGWAAALA